MPFVFNTQIHSSRNQWDRFKASSFSNLDQSNFHPKYLSISNYVDIDTVASPTYHLPDQLSLTSVSNAEVLSSQDIIIGTFLAFILAFGYSYLNGQSTSSDFVSWRSGPQTNNKVQKSVMAPSEEAALSNSTVFNETNWKEMSREENYILYNTRIRKKKSSMSKVSTVKDTASDSSMNTRENKLVVIALLAVFLPIFSIEIFFALSRQFLCEGGLFGGTFGVDLADRLCSPIFRGER